MRKLRIPRIDEIGVAKCMLLIALSRQYNGESEAALVALQRAAVEFESVRSEKGGQLSFDMAQCEFIIGETYMTSGMFVEAKRKMTFLIRELLSRDSLKIEREQELLASCYLRRLACIAAIGAHLQQAISDYHAFVDCYEGLSLESKEGLFSDYCLVRLRIEEHRVQSLAERLETLDKLFVESLEIFERPGLRAIDMLVPYAICEVTHHLCLASSDAEGAVKRVELLLNTIQTLPDSAGKSLARCHCLLLQIDAYRELGGTERRALAVKECALLAERIALAEDETSLYFYPVVAAAYLEFTDFQVELHPTLGTEKLLEKISANLHGQVELPLVRSRLLQQRALKEFHQDNLELAVASLIASNEAIEESNSKHIPQIVLTNRLAIMLLLLAGDRPNEAFDQLSVHLTESSGQTRISSVQLVVLNNLCWFACTQATAAPLEIAESARKIAVSLRTAKPNLANLWSTEAAALASTGDKVNAIVRMLKAKELAGNPTRYTKHLEMLRRSERIVEEQPELGKWIDGVLPRLFRIDSFLEERRFEM